MAAKKLKKRLYQLIYSTDNEPVLEHVLAHTEDRPNSHLPHELEGLSEKDFAELQSLVEEEPLKDAMTYDELKFLLERWFTK